MFKKIQLIFVKWLNGVLSYIVSWLGLRMFYECYFVTDYNDKVQALLFTNDARHIMIMKDEAKPLMELIDKLEGQIQLLEETLIQKGIVINYEKINDN